MGMHRVSLASLDLTETVSSRARSCCSEAHLRTSKRKVVCPSVSLGLT